MREKGLLNIGANFEVGSQSPFDARLKVSTFTDLTDNLETTYPEKNVYRTMCVSVEDENAIYMLIVDPDTLYSSSDRKTCWKKIGADLSVHVQQSGEKIDTEHDIRLFDLVETEGGIVVGTEATSYALTLSTETDNFTTRTVNCIVNNKTERDITVTLPTVLSGWTITNGMTFTTIAPGKSGEFNFLLIPASKTIRILGGVLS